MINTIASWKCKCGVRVKVVSETDRSRPSEKITVSCPDCGDQQIIDTHRIVSVTAEYGGLFEQASKHLRSNGA
jgi:hypothetical protein